MIPRPILDLLATIGFVVLVAAWIPPGKDRAYSCNLASDLGRLD